MKKKKDTTQKVVSDVGYTGTYATYDTDDGFPGTAKPNDTRAFFFNRYGFRLHCYMNEAKKTVVVYVSKAPSSNKWDEMLTKMFEGKVPKVVHMEVKGRKFCGKASCNPLDTFDPKAGLELATFRAIKQYMSYKQDNLADQMKRNAQILEMARKKVEEHIPPEVKKDEKVKQ